MTQQKSRVQDHDQLAAMVTGKFGEDTSTLISISKLPNHANVRALNPTRFNVQHSSSLSRAFGGSRSRNHEPTDATPVPSSK
ncbi:hypothetical protein TNCV_3476361 [Trichonephila clavipes]|nr:hypothetical protein TNCV_3476361 [Trichonephila clavipes]